MIRVLEVFGRLNRGGAEMRTLDVLREIDRNQFSIDMVALTDQPGDLDEDFRQLGCRVIHCPLDSMLPWRFPRLVVGYDVVHVHLQFFSGYILRLARWAGVPRRIIHFRGTTRGNERRWRYPLQTRIMQHLIQRDATRIVGNGESSLALAWNREWRRDPRCLVIPNGLDHRPLDIVPDPEGVRKEFGFPSQAPLVVHVGRMDLAKNHLRLAEICRTIYQMHSETRFLFIGREDPDIGNRLRSRLEALGMTEVVRLTGTRQDVGRLIHAADLLLFPSLHEGVPGAVLEAGAIGLPVLASDLPGVQEIARHLRDIHQMPLSSPDTAWANTAWNILVRHRQKDRVTNAKEALRRFARTIFALPNCIKAHEILWKGGGRSDIDLLYQQ